MDDGQPEQFLSYSPQAQMASSSSAVWSSSAVAGSPGYPPVYAMANRQDNVQYGQGADSPQFQQSRDAYAMQAQYQSGQLSTQGIDLDDLPQIDSSVGPTRVQTRRQTRAAQVAIQQNRVASGNSLDGAIREGSLSTTYYQSPTPPHSASRPQTPNGSRAQQFSPHAPDAGTLMTPDISQSSSGSQGSPPYPSTPLSATSATYSPFGFFRHSRSGSNVTSNPRSASPALSVVSALTSLSSTSAAHPSASTSDGRLSPTILRHKPRKGRLSNGDRRDICLYASRTPAARQEDIANLFHVERSTISKILKARDKWLASPREDDSKFARHKPSKFPEIERKMETWLKEHQEKYQDRSVPPLSDHMIRSRAKEIARSLNIPEDKFKASSGWVENFKHRHNIRRGIWNNEQNREPSPFRAAIQKWTSTPEPDDTIVDALIEGTELPIEAHTSVLGVITTNQHGGMANQSHMLPPPGIIPHYAPSVMRDPQPSTPMPPLWTSSNTTQPNISQVPEPTFQHTAALHAPNGPQLNQHITFEQPQDSSSAEQQSQLGYQPGGMQSHLDNQSGLNGAASFMPPPMMVHHPNDHSAQGQQQQQASGDAGQHGGGVRVDVDQAERSMDYLIQFFDSHPEGAIISPEDREKLAQIRSKLSTRAAGGLPFQRDERRRTTV